MQDLSPKKNGEKSNIMPDKFEIVRAHFGA